MSSEIKDSSKNILPNESPSHSSSPENKHRPTKQQQAVYVESIEDEVNFVDDAAALSKYNLSNDTEFNNSQIDDVQSSDADTTSSEFNFSSKQSYINAIAEQYILLLKNQLLAQAHLQNNSATELIPDRINWQTIMYQLINLSENNSDTKSKDNSFSVTQAATVFKSDEKRIINKVADYYKQRGLSVKVSKTKSRLNLNQINEIIQEMTDNQSLALNLKSDVKNKTVKDGIKDAKSEINNREERQKKSIKDKLQLILHQQDCPQYEIKAVWNNRSDINNSNNKDKRISQQNNNLSDFKSETDMDNNTQFINQLTETEINARNSLHQLFYQNILDYSKAVLYQQLTDSIQQNKSFLFLIPDKELLTKLLEDEFNLNIKSEKITHHKLSAQQKTNQMLALLALKLFNTELISDLMKYVKDELKMNCSEFKSDEEVVLNDRRVPVMINNQITVMDKMKMKLYGIKIDWISGIKNRKMNEK